MKHLFIQFSDGEYYFNKFEAFKNTYGSKWSVDTVRSLDSVIDGGANYIGI